MNRRRRATGGTSRWRSAGPGAAALLRRTISRTAGRRGAHGHGPRHQAAGSTAPQGEPAGWGRPAPEAVARRLERLWLPAANLVVAPGSAGSALAPLFAACGRARMTTFAYPGSRPNCPRWPDRSFFRIGHELALERRMLALAGGTLLCGTLFAPVQRRLRPLTWRLVVLAAIPTRIGVLSRAVGWPDCTWQWPAPASGRRPAAQGRDQRARPPDDEHHSRGVGRSATASWHTPAPAGGPRCIGCRRRPLGYPQRTGRCIGRVL